jgi:hypothetical protein
MVRTSVAVLALGASLALGTVGVAAAAPRGTERHPAQTPHCANASAALNRIAMAQSRITTHLSLAQTRLAAAQAPRNTTATQRIEVRITRLQELDTRLGARQQRIEAACSGATGS